MMVPVSVMMVASRDSLREILYVRKLSTLRGAREVGRELVQLGSCIGISIRLSGLSGALQGVEICCVTCWYWDGLDCCICCSVLSIWAKGDMVLLSWRPNREDALVLLALLVLAELALPNAVPINDWR